MMEAPNAILSISTDDTSTTTDTQHNLSRATKSPSLSKDIVKFHRSYFGEGEENLFQAKSTERSSSRTQSAIITMLNFPSPEYSEKCSMIANVSPVAEKMQHTIVTGPVQSKCDGDRSFEAARNADLNADRSCEAARNAGQNAVILERLESFHSIGRPEQASLLSPSQSAQADDSSSSNSDSTTINKKRKRSTIVGRWTEEEHQEFLVGLSVFGREWKKVAARIPTRTPAQVRSHAQKYFAKLERKQKDLGLDVSDGTETNLNSDAWSSTTTDDSTLVPKSTDAYQQIEAGLASEDMTESARIEAAKIMAEPEIVEQEVQRTLQQLHERYRQLQERLQERQKAEQQKQMGACAGGETLMTQDYTTCCKNESVRSQDELIAVKVLQGGLFKVTMEL